MIKLKDIIKEFELGHGDAYGGIEIMSREFENALSAWDDAKDEDRIPYEQPVKENKKIMSIIKKRTIKKISDSVVVAYFKSSGEGQYLLLNLNGHKYDYVDSDSVLMGTIDVETNVVNVASYWGPNIRKAFALPNTTAMVHWSYLAPSFRGQGYGKALYDIAIDHAKALISDETLYQGSFNMWSHHMSKKKFFGVMTIGEENAWSIIPVDAKVASNRDFVGERGYRFVAISDKTKIPEPLLRVRRELRGVDISRGLVVGAPTIGTSFKSWSVRIDEYGDGIEDKTRKDLNKFIDDVTIEDMKTSKGIPIVEFLEDHVDSLEDLFGLVKSMEDRSGFTSTLVFEFNWTPMGMDMYDGVHTLSTTAARKLQVFFIAFTDAVLVVSDGGNGLDVKLL